MLRKTGPNTVNPDDLLTQYKLDISSILISYVRNPDEIYKNDRNEECDARLQKDRINIATYGLDKIFAAKNMLEVKTLIAIIKKALKDADTDARNRFTDRANEASNYSIDIGRGVDPDMTLSQISLAGYLPDTTVSKVSQSRLTSEIHTTWTNVSRECEKISPNNNITEPQTKQHIEKVELSSLTNNKFIVAEKLKQYIDKQSRPGASILNLRRDPEIFAQRLELAQNCLNNVLNARSSQEILNLLTTASTKNQAIKTEGKLQTQLDNMISELQTALEIQKPVNPVEEMQKVTEGKDTPMELQSLPSTAGHFKPERRPSTEQKVKAAPAAPATRPRKSSSSG